MGKSDYVVTTGEQRGLWAVGVDALAACAVAGGASYYLNLGPVALLAVAWSALMLIEGGRRLLHGLRPRIS